jgi:hypothetical protein
MSAITSPGFDLFYGFRTLTPVYLIVSASLALFNSHIKYAIILWGNAANQETVLQKKAARVVSFAGKIDHCQSLFFNLSLVQLRPPWSLIGLAIFVKYKLADCSKK